MSIKDRSTKSVDRRAAGQATARSAVYATLSAVLAGDEAGIDAVRLHAVQSLEGEGRDSEAVRRVRAQLSAVLGRRSNAELLRSQRSLLPPVESADLPAYESAYCGSDIFRQAQQMADIAGVYRAHGLTVGGARRERPDHVAVELEFMAFLTAKEADALLHLGPDQVRMCREGQALFLGEHLGRWTPLFARRLADRADGGPYRAVAEVLEAWIAAELRGRGVEVARPPEPPNDPLPDVGASDDGCALDADGALG